MNSSMRHYLLFLLITCYHQERKRPMRAFPMLPVSEPLNELEGIVLKMTSEQRAGLVGADPVKLQQALEQMPEATRVHEFLLKCWEGEHAHLFTAITEGKYGQPATAH